MKPKYHIRKRLKSTDEQSTGELLTTKQKEDIEKNRTALLESTIEGSPYCQVSQESFWRRHFVAIILALISIAVILSAAKFFLNGGGLI